MTSSLGRTQQPPTVVLKAKMCVVWGKSGETWIDNRFDVYAWIVLQGLRCNALALSRRYLGGCHGTDSSPTVWDGVLDCKRQAHEATRLFARPGLGHKFSSFLLVELQVCPVLDLFWGSSGSGSPFQLQPVNFCRVFRDDYWGCRSP